MKNFLRLIPVGQMLTLSFFLPMATGCRFGPRVMILPWGDEEILLFEVNDPTKGSELSIFIGQMPDKTSLDIQKAYGLGGKSPILIWCIMAHRTIPFFVPSFQFTQKGSQYTPSVFDPREFRVLEGEMASPLRSGSTLAGYIIMPDDWDYFESLQVFHGVDIFHPSDELFSTQLRLRSMKITF